MKELLEKYQNKTTKCQRLGLTIDKKMTTLKINYGGNMGCKIITDINPRLVDLGLPSVAELKQLYPSYVEKGSPDYWWEIEFNLQVGIEFNLQVET